MTDDLRTAALDAYVSRQEADGYRVETRTAVQAVIFRRRWDLAPTTIRRASSCSTAR